MIAPLLAERVELVSERPPAEVLAAVEGLTSRASALWGWQLGTGIARRGRAGGRLLLAVRHGYGDSLRPIAFVSVRPSEAGTRVTGVIRPLRVAQVVYAFVAVLGVLLTLAGVVAAVVDRTGVPLLAGAAFAAVSLGAPWVSYRDRATLRALLEDVVR